MPESRLTRRSLKQSKNQLYTSLFGIVAILVVALTFGPTIIGTAGNLIDKLTGKTGRDVVINSNTEIQPPTLDSVPQATPSATIIITGKTDYQNGEIELYVNNSLFDKTNVDNSQTFTFEKVPLSNGNNSIKARMIINGKKSDFPDTQNVSLAKNAPKLDITFPSDHQTFKKADQAITAKGTTDPDNNVTVNGSIAIVDGAGNFSYDINLKEGDNKLVIEAKNTAGATTSHEITVSYSP